MIPHPKGTAGNDSSIQVVMHLAGSENKDKKYGAIMQSWSNIPAGEKAKLFSVAQERHPVLQKYTND
ncbi:hypothetical protein BYT27DRAFT_7088852 [Phlegmacium glaucopus]|nr:hypothetical protein BYT27DRAFT_7088852 [Phlegmacium glaucopus]